MNEFVLCEKIIMRFCTKATILRTLCRDAILIHRVHFSPILMQMVFEWYFPCEVEKYLFYCVRYD